MNAEQLDVDYVARIDNGPEMRRPMNLIVAKPELQEGTKKEGQLYNWTVAEGEALPLITSTYLDVQGRCIQNIDEGGQHVVPVPGCLDKLTVYLPPHYRDSMRAVVLVNSRPTLLDLSCMHQTTQSGSEDVVKLEAGDRFGMWLENSAGKFGHVAISVRFREV